MVIIGNIVDDPTENIAFRKHVAFTNTHANYKFPVVMGAYVIDPSCLLKFSDGLSHQVTVSPGVLFLGGDYDFSFWYAFADCMIDLYITKDYRDHISLVANTLPDEFGTLAYTDPSLDRGDVCGWMADFFYTKYSGSANILETLSRDYSITIVCSNLIYTGEKNFYKYSEIDPIKIVSEVSPSKACILLSRERIVGHIGNVAIKWRRVDKLDGVHGYYFKNIDPLKNISPIDVSIVNIINDVKTSNDVNDRLAKLYTLAHDVGKKKDDESDPIKKQEWKSLYNGIADQAMPVHDYYKSYLVVDNMKKSASGKENMKETHKFVHAANVSGVRSHKFIANLRYNDGVYYECNSDTKWNEDKVIHENGTFYVTMAEILLDEIYSNPFFRLYSDANKIPGEGDTRLLYDSEKLVEGRVIGDDIRGLPRYESARDQLAGEIRTSFGGSADDFEIAGMKDPAFTNIMRNWGFSTKLFVTDICNDVVAIRKIHSYAIPPAKILLQISMVSDHVHVSYSKVEDVNNLGFNLLLYTEGYKYKSDPASDVWVDNYKNSTDRKKYLEDNKATAPVLDTDHEDYLVEPTPVSYTTDLRYMCYIHDIDEYPIDQLNYDKIVDHIIRINTISRSNFVFNMWFSDPMRIAGVIRVDHYRSLYYAVANGIHRLLSDGWQYAKYMGTNDLFPGASIADLVSGKTFQDIYDAETTERDKISTIYNGIVEYTGGDAMAFDELVFVNMLNTFKLRVCLSVVDHSRSGVRYIIPTVAKNGSHTYKSDTGSRYHNHYARWLDKEMTSPIFFSISIAQILFKSDSIFAYVESIDGSDFAPTPYMAKFRGEDISKKPEIIEIWRKKGDDKKAAIKQFYDDNIGSTDIGMKLLLKNLYKEEKCNTRFYYLQPYDPVLHPSQPAYHNMMGYVIYLNALGREYTYDRYAIDHHHDYSYKGPFSRSRQSGKLLLSEFLLGWMENGIHEGDADIIATIRALLPDPFTDTLITDWSADETAKDALRGNLKLKIWDVLGGEYLVCLQDGIIKYFDIDGAEINEALKNVVENIFGDRFGIEITAFRHTISNYPINKYTHLPFCSTDGYGRSKAKIVYVSLINDEFYELINPKNYNFIESLPIPQDRVDEINDIICKNNKPNLDADLAAFFAATAAEVFWQDNKAFYGIPDTTSTTSSATATATSSATATATVTSSATATATVTSSATSSAKATTTATSSVVYQPHTQQSPEPLAFCESGYFAHDSRQSENLYVLKEYEKKILCNMVHLMLKDL